jgi:hypothetical protein
VEPFAWVAQCVEARVTQFQAELVFALWAKGTIALMASRVSRARLLFGNVNFRMDFEHSHRSSPNQRIGKRDAKVQISVVIAKRLT